MKNTQLQLMVYGTNIGTYKPVINHSGVVLKSVHSMESPNYSILYLDIKDAKPGTFVIEFVKGKKKQRSYNGKSVLVVMNGVSKEADLEIW